MWYEIFLRLKEPGPEPARSLREGLVADPAARETARGLEVGLSAGVLTLVFQPDDPADWDLAQTRGVDVRLPGGANAELASAACAAVFQWAERYGLTVYDPQLGRAVTDRDTEAMLVRVGRLADYLTETVGIDERAEARHIDVDRPRQKLSLRTRFYLGLAIFLGLLLVLARYC